jgi:hypothetical protein
VFKGDGIYERFVTKGKAAGGLGEYGAYTPVTPACQIAFSLQINRTKFHRAARRGKCGLVIRVAPASFVESGLRPVSRLNLLACAGVARVA